MKRRILSSLAFGALVLAGIGPLQARAENPALVYYDGSEAAKPGHTGLVAALEDSGTEFVSTDQLEEALAAIGGDTYQLIAIVTENPDSAAIVQKIAGAAPQTPLLFVSPGRDGTIRSNFTNFLPVEQPVSPVTSQSISFSMEGGSPKLESSSGVLMSFEPWRADNSQEALKLEMMKGPLDWISGGISDWLDKLLEKLRQKAVCAAACLQQFLRDIPTKGVTVRIKTKVTTTPPGVEVEVEVEATGEAVKQLIEAQIKLMKCMAAC